MRWFRRYTVVLIVVGWIIIQLITHPAHMQLSDVAQGHHPYLVDNDGHRVHAEKMILIFHRSTHAIEYQGRWWDSVRYSLLCDLSRNMKLDCEMVAYFGTIAVSMNGGYGFVWY